MSETAPAPGPEDKPGRREKTPAEVNAQVTRISKKLIERAQKLENPKSDRVTVSEPGKALLNTESKALRTTSKDGRSHNAIITAAGRVMSHASGPAGDTVLRHMASDTDLSSDRDNTEKFTRKYIELGFHHTGNYGSLEKESLQSVNGRMQDFDDKEYTELPSAANPDTAAKILMKTRGAIADQEIAEKTARAEASAAAQEEVNELLK